MCTLFSKPVFDDQGLGVSGKRFMNPLSAMSFVRDRIAPPFVRYLMPKQRIVVVWNSVV